MEHWYIFGSRAQRPPTLVVLTRDERAWRARSTDVDYQHDYPVTQSLEDVVEWIRKDTRARPRRAKPARTRSSCCPTAA